jgi:hypothetical protein
VQDLLARLQPSDAVEVSRIWDALLVAQRDAEMLASRGVRIARDISRDWQETVSDLIDRVVTQDGELGTLRAQVCIHPAMCTWDNHCAASKHTFTLTQQHLSAGACAVDLLRTCCPFSHMRCIPFTQNS